MGKDLVYYFYDENLNEVDKSKFDLRILNDYDFIGIYFHKKYSLQKFKHNNYSLYDIDELLNIVNEHGQRFKTFDLLSLDLEYLNNENEDIVQLFQLSQILRLAFTHNKFYLDPQIKYLSMDYI